MKKFFPSIIFLLFSALVFPSLAFAHEAYVLSPEQFHQGLTESGTNPFAALRNPDNLRIFLTISGVIVALLVLNFLFRHSKPGRALNEGLGKLSRFGPVVVRLAIGVSFLFSALSWSFLGPEIPLQSLMFPEILRIGLFISSILIVTGLFAELAALIAFIVFGFAVLAHGFYLMTYLNYLGELVVLLFFGSRYLSLDRIIFGLKKYFMKLQKYETAIIRVCYGIGFTFTAISVKFLHPQLTSTVVIEYNLTRFHWLFPQDPLLVVFGAGLAELIIGIFIIFGFELRLTVFITLIYLTLSLIYFRELVWPHLILYGISIDLMVDKERFTLDHFFDRIKILRRMRLKSLRRQ